MTLTFSLANSEGWSHPKPVSLDGGRKPDYPEKSHAALLRLADQPGGSFRGHSVRPQVTYLLL